MFFFFIIVVQMLVGSIRKISIYKYINIYKYIQRKIETWLFVYVKKIVNKSLHTYCTYVRPTMACLQYIKCILSVCI